MNTDVDVSFRVWLEHITLRNFIQEIFCEGNRWETLGAMGVDCISVLSVSAISILLNIVCKRSL